MTAHAFVLRHRLPLAALVVLAGCVTVPVPAPVPTPRPPGAPAAPAAPALGFFSRIKVPDGFEPALHLSGKGVQIFRCEPVEDEYLWSFRQPEAELTDDGGQVVARHGASFTFEHRDGSRLVATITAYDEAPNRNDLRWLLFATKSFGKGVFTPITHVQRINTSGGTPPARCQAADANRLLRVNFSADFVFYRARS